MKNFKTFEDFVNESSIRITKKMEDPILNSLHPQAATEWDRAKEYYLHKANGDIQKTLKYVDSEIKSYRSQKGDHVKGRIDGLNAFKEFILSRNESLKSVNEGEDLSVDMLNSIDFSPLEKEISKILKVNVKLDKKDLKNIRGRNFLSVESSKDLIGDAGIFTNILSTVIVKSFNSEYVNRGKDNYLWMTWTVSYQDKTRGSNGIQFLTSWYYPRFEKWEFRQEK